MTTTAPSVDLRSCQRIVPPTRYQGSKRKLASAIVEELRTLDFTTVLDAFGGTGAVAYALKAEGKRVTYNDVLAFNEQVGLALIENDHEQLGAHDIDSVVRGAEGVVYGDVIERTFAGLYFTREENRWLDRVVENIRRLPTRYKRAMAWYAVYQSALAKRPYNLFHRGNLYMRTADVPRSFGNKKTWDRPFDELFRRFAEQANNAVVDGGGSCRTLCKDVLDVTPEYDLVYIDPPYINARGVGVDYQQFYHFLEGMTDYDRWAERIDTQFRHRPLKRQPQPWTDPRRVHAAFERLFGRFRESTLVVSYRSDGTPTIDELAATLRRYKPKVRVIDGPQYQYALSTNRRSREALLIGEAC